MYKRRIQCVYRAYTVRIQGTYRTFYKMCKVSIQGIYRIYKEHIHGVYRAHTGSAYTRFITGRIHNTKRIQGIEKIEKTFSLLNELKFKIKK